MTTASTPPEHAESGGAVPGRVWSGTALQVGGRLFGAAATFTTLVVLARHLSGAEFGRYTFFIAVFMLLDALADFGTGAVAVQRTATRPDEVAATLKTARRIRLVAGSCGFLILGIATLIAKEPGGLWIWLAALYPLTHAFEVSAVPFKNRIDWRMPVKARLVASGLRLVLILSLWQLGVEAAGPFVFAAALGSSIANFLIHFAARHELRNLSQRHAPPIPWRPFLRAAAPLGIAGLAQQAYFYIDNLFVRPLAGEVELGHYNAGVRLLSFAIMLAQYASLAALPWFARRDRQGELAAAVARLGQPLLLAAAIGCGLCIPFSGALMELIFGAEFASAGPAMAWLFGAVGLIYFGSLHLTAVVATGHTRSVATITFCALAVNVVGNAFLVPSHGIEGAAIATFITEAVVAVLALRCLVRSGRSTLNQRPLLWLAAPLAFSLSVGLAHFAAGILKA